MNARPVTFADVTFGNLTEDQARFVQANTPDEARAHVKPSIHAGFFMVLVEDLSITGARDLLALLAAKSQDFPDVPNWRDTRTGTTEAWTRFARAHNISYPAGANRVRIAMAVRSWLEKNR